VFHNSLLNFIPTRSRSLRGGWIELVSGGTGCAAHVCYRHTSLGPSEDEFVSQFTNSYHASFMREWEHELDHFLSTGQRLPPGGGANAPGADESAEAS
jgi:hypothetical protein